MSRAADIFSPGQGKHRGLPLRISTGHDHCSDVLVPCINDSDSGGTLAYASSQEIKYQIII
ncbi:MAG: hypothetical protein B6245_24345 [Desulfobacteraceae bacterium 4572_88]|nr:MAG: hypothetical protein B6245_24345 [Desulfobacteraceae bacterium 4572_88]